MKEIKLLHTADIHFSRDHQKPALLSLNTLIRTAEDEKPDLIIIAGDLFNRPVNDTTSSGFPKLFKSIQDLVEVAPVVAVQGTTPLHDAPGCYEPFEAIRAKHRFTLLEPRAPYFLTSTGKVQGDVWSKENPVSEGEARLLIFGIPEPSKEWFLSDKQLGKAEADEAIKKGMRELLLGMAAIRKRYPHIPCVLIYHGSIAGKRLDNVQFLPAFDIEIGRDDLSLVGADYYALGHIHLAQQLSNLPAYYPGSAFPVDWGELNQKSFNNVQIVDTTEVDGPVKPCGRQFCELVNRIPYPHPPRKKIEITVTSGGGSTDKAFAEGIADRADGECKGYQVWLNVKMPKMLKGHVFEADTCLNRLLQKGAIRGSRVTKTIIPTETVRSERITESSRLRDKVKIYAELSGEKVAESILEKADEIERAAWEEGQAPMGLHIRIRKIVLRGAIGIKKGTSQDQVEIDLDQYDPGLIALVGPNGMGKSTLIENMHPYPQLLTRAGKLQDHFCLRDSFRDLYFTDERNGTEYRAFMQIDGVNKTGSVEYYLYKGENGQWIPYSEEINGRQAPYIETVEKLFGSLPLFLRSAFVSQKQPKNLPDLSEATKGEKKALFRELGGLDYLQLYSDYAKQKAQGLERELVELRAKAPILERELEELPIKRNTLSDLREELEKSQQSLALIEENGKKLKKALDRVEARVSRNKELQVEIRGLDGQLRELFEEWEKLKAEYDTYHLALGMKEKYEKELKEYEDLKAEEAKLNEEKAKILENRERIQREYNAQREAVSDDERALQAEKAGSQSKAASLQADRASVKSKAEALDEELREPVTEDCPTCGQKWPAEKKAEFEQKRAKKQRNLHEFQEKLFEFDKEIAKINKAIKECDEKIGSLEWPDPPFLPEADFSKLNDIKTRLNEIDIGGLREKVDQSRQAETKITELAEAIRKNEAATAEKRQKKHELSKQVDPKCDEEYRVVSAEIEKARAEYSEADKHIARIETEITATEKAIDSLEEKKKELDRINSETGEKDRDRQEWEWLQRACGPDGIQALELDAMGPDIADVATKLLGVAYEIYPWTPENREGNPFNQLRFETTRIGGQGSRRRQIEDFLVYVYDVRDDDWVELSRVSGGEIVWIIKALYSAFATKRLKNTGMAILTGFLDEADGALWPNARLAYFRMLERAHAESGRYQTLIVTHSEQAQEVIAQKIRMEGFYEKDPVVTRS